MGNPGRKEGMEMLSKQQFLEKHPEIKKGMLVYDRNSNKLGKISELQENHFTIHKGVIMSKNINLLYDDIIDVSDEDITININPSA
jgi:hypothetical protein